MNAMTVVLDYGPFTCDQCGFKAPEMHDSDFYIFKEQQHHIAILHGKSGDTRTVYCTKCWCEDDE